MAFRRVDAVAARQLALLDVRIRRTRAEVRQVYDALNTVNAHMPKLRRPARCTTMAPGVLDGSSWPSRDPRRGSGYTCDEYSQLGRVAPLYGTANMTARRLMESADDSPWGAPFPERPSVRSGIAPPTCLLRRHAGAPATREPPPPRPHQGNDAGSGFCCQRSIPASERGHGQQQRGRNPLGEPTHRRPAPIRILASAPQIADPTPSTLSLALLAETLITQRL